jgi:anti-sigma B factor antagonist
MDTVPRKTGNGNQLEIQTETTAEAKILCLSGEVDLVTVPMLSSTLKTLAEDGCDVIVDLSGLQYIDSTGFKALFDANELFLDRRQRLVVSGHSPVACKIIEVIGFDKIVPVLPSVEAARKFISEPRTPQPLAGRVDPGP